MAILSKPFQALKPQLKGVEEIPRFSGAILTLGALIALLYFGRVFFITSLAAVIIAFILEPFVGLLMQARFPRSLASFVVCTIALLFLYLVALGAYAQLAGLWEDLPQYSARIGEIVETIQSRVESMEQKTSQMLTPSRRRQEELEQRLEAQRQAEQQAQTRRRRRAADPPPAPAQPGTIPEVRIREEPKAVGDYIYQRLGDVYQILLMLSFIPFLVYFMLSWRDHIHRSFLQLFQGEDRLVAARSLQGIAEMVRAFVVGNFVLGALLAVASSAAFWLLPLPYALLVGPLSGFLSLVPYVGLPLALIPPMFVALTVIKTLSGYLLVFAIVSAFHLLALNLLYPKIVGSRVHLNPLVVTFSLMFWGFLWDAPGLVLAIPLTAAIKAICDNVKELRPIGKFLGD